MEPEALATIAVMFVLLCLFACRTKAVVEEEQEEEIEDLEDEEEAEDKTLLEIRAYHLIAREVSVKRANGDVYEVKFRHDEPTKVVHNVAAVTPEQTKMVWSEGGRMLQRETLNWGGEQ
jgi:hypothetical protein